MLIALCILGYLIGAGLTSGFFQAHYDYDGFMDDPGPLFAGLFWPLAILCFLVVFPIHNLGMYLTNRTKEMATKRQAQKAKIRHQLELVNKRAELELQQAQQELENSSHLSLERQFAALEKQEALLQQRTRV